MIIKLYEGTEIIVNKQEGQKVIEAMTAGTKVIIVKGQAVRPNAIAAVIDGGHTQPDVVDESRQINAPKIKLGKGYEAFQKKRQGLRKKLSIKP